MHRPTKSEIEAYILDKAAGLFARHGFEHASIKQIADAVGYSKAGLLHHFPSKQAIYDAVLATLRLNMESMRDAVKDVPVGKARDAAVVAASVDFAVSHPGISSLGDKLALDPDPTNQALNEIGYIMYDAIGVDLGAIDIARLIRITSAFSGLSVTTGIAVRVGLVDQWREGIIEAAMNALGHASHRTEN